MAQDINTIKNKLNQYFKLGKNVLLEGRHGTGKTTLVTEVFSQNCKNWLYFSGSTLDPWVDFVGVTKEIKKGNDYVLSFVLPEKMADENVEAIFIDEYNRSHKKIRNATMELVQFKSINGRKFPNLKVVWAAINPNDEDEEHQGLQGPALIRPCDASPGQPDASRPAATADCHGLAQLCRLIKVSDH